MHRDDEISDRIDRGSQDSSVLYILKNPVNPVYFQKSLAEKAPHAGK
jgi:hypothetical protein